MDAVKPNELTCPHLKFSYMTITSSGENCDHQSPALFEESLDSVFSLDLRLPGSIPSSQSRQSIRDTITALIRAELAKVQWVCYGPVWIELTWWLHATERQETDAVGDLDNITKPILDALTGWEGIMVDDTQMKSIYTRWLTKNRATPAQSLRIDVKFLNEDALMKAKAYFIQYYQAMCFIIDLNPKDAREVKDIRAFADAKILQRRISAGMRQLGANVADMLVASQKDFHRTRLRGVPQDRIIRLSDLYS